jgi:hypothetical protein
VNVPEVGEVASKRQARCRGMRDWNSWALWATAAQAVLLMIGWEGREVSVSVYSALVMRQYGVMGWIGLRRGVGPVGKHTKR